MPTKAEQYVLKETGIDIPPVDSMPEATLGSSLMPVRESTTETRLDGYQHVRDGINGCGFHGALRRMIRIVHNGFEVGDSKGF